MERTTEELCTALDLLAEEKRISGWDANFAASIARQRAGGKVLSYRQIEVVQRIVCRAESGIEEEAAELPDLSGTYAIFAHASKQLKYPKITFRHPTLGTIRFVMAGKRSKHPGAINVTDGGPYGDNRWYGRIGTDGGFTAGRAATTEVLGFLREFSVDPAGIAAAYGKESGSCCFCDRHLTDARSCVVGYGPVCANRYGLSWGK